MTTPVTGAGNPSRVARRLISVPCRPAPSMSIPMPSRSCQVAASPPGLTAVLAGAAAISHARGDQPEKDPGDARNETRALEARVVLGHAPLVLGEAEVEPPVQRHFSPEILVCGQREILAGAGVVRLRLAHAARRLHP